MSKANAGLRIVEPYMIAYNEKNHLVLNGWFDAGTSKSATGPGWREYEIAKISQVVILDQKSTFTQPDYKPNGGEKFHSVQCAR